MVISCFALHTVTSRRLLKQQSHKRTRTISRAVVNEKTAPIVQRVSKLYDQGFGYKSVAMDERDQFRIPLLRVANILVES